MTLEALQKEMVLAMKSGDKFRKGVIATVIGQAKSAAIDKGCRDNISEELVNETLLKGKKITQEMVDSCPDFRADLLEDYKKQLEIICEFAPKLITDEEEIRCLLIDLIGGEIELTKPNRGKIMKVVAPALKNKVDMGVVNKVLGGMLK